MIRVPRTPVEIHAFVLPGGGAAVNPEDWDLLSGAERTRASRYRYPRERDNFTAGRAALRRLLGPGAEISLGPAGKPSTPGVTFNVSHTKSHAVVALTRDPAVETLGIDVERIDPGFPHLQAARRHFPSSEMAALEALSPSLLPAAFTRLWTAREAALKALGTGLQWQLDRVEINPAITLATTGDDQFSLHQIDIPGFPPDHLVTLAIGPLQQDSPAPHPKSPDHLHHARQPT